MVYFYVLCCFYYTLLTCVALLSALVVLNVLSDKVWVEFSWYKLNMAGCEAVIVKTNECEPFVCWALEIHFQRRVTGMLLQENYESENSNEVKRK